MPNLIEQLNQIKGLSDEALAAEMSQPSGVTPPYLVMTELNRRKDMRQRYEGELARKQKSTTVAEDLMSAGAPSGGMPPMASMGGPQAMGGSGLPAAFGGGGGLSAALNQPNVPMGTPVPGNEGVPGFAPGGLVDYESIANRYNDKLSNTGDRQKRAQALALLSAGAAMMGGGSNTMANIGAGINAGVGSYSGQLEAIDNEEMETLRGLLDVQRLQYGEDADTRNYDQREREMAQNRELSMARLNDENLPMSVKEARWAANEATPEELAALKESRAAALNPLSVDNAAWTRSSAIAKAYDSLFEKAQVEVLAAVEDDMQGLGKQLISQDPAERAQAMKDIEMMAREKAVEDLATSYVGEEFAPYIDQYRQQLAAMRGGGTQMTGAPAGNDPLSLR